jgi:hypothetical protein
MGKILCPSNQSLGKRVKEKKKADVDKSKDEWPMVNWAETVAGPVFHV